MKKRVNTQNVLIIALSVVVIVMSIGFATIERDLQVTGTVKLTGNLFQVQFRDNSYQESAGSVTASNVTLTGTSGTYTITLDKPGDFYEFTGVIENVGDFNADLKSITLTNSLSEAQKKHLTYTVYYDSTAYTAANNTITNVTLNKKVGSTIDSDTFKVRVDYNVPTENDDLLTEDITGITLGVTFHYEQSAS